MEVMDPGLGPPGRPRMTAALLFDPQLRISDHLAPFLDLGLDARGELVRRIGDRVEAKRGEPLFHVSLRDRFGDLLIENIDNLFGVAAGTTIPVSVSAS